MVHKLDVWHTAGLPSDPGKNCLPQGFLILIAGQFLHGTWGAIATGQLVGM